MQIDVKISLAVMDLFAGLAPEIKGSLFLVLETESISLSANRWVSSLGLSRSIIHLCSHA